MDLTDLRSLSTVFVFLAIIGIFLWAYSSKKKPDFDEAAQLPFADDEPDSAEHQSQKHQ